METVIVSLICIGLVIFGGMTMSQGFLTSVDTSTTGLEEVSDRGELIMRTDLDPASATLNVSRDILDVDLDNNGQTKLADFEKWDVIVQYYDDVGTYHIKWLPYANGIPGDDEWGIEWIRLNGSPEVFEPNVFNPGEQIRIRAQLDPAAGPGTTNLVVISTPSGIPAYISFTP